MSLTPKLRPVWPERRQKQRAGWIPEARPAIPASSLHLFISRHWIPCGLCHARESLVAAHRLKRVRPPTSGSRQFE